MASLSINSDGALTARPEKHLDLWAIGWEKMTWIIQPGDNLMRLLGPRFFSSDLTEAPWSKMQVKVKRVTAVYGH